MTVIADVLGSFLVDRILQFCFASSSTKLDLWSHSLDQRSPSSSSSSVSFCFIHRQWLFVDCLLSCRKFYAQMCYVLDMRQRPCLLFWLGGVRWPCYFGLVVWVDPFVLSVTKVTTCLENLEMSGNLKQVREMSGILLTVKEMSGYLCHGNVSQNYSLLVEYLHFDWLALHCDFILRNHYELIMNLMVWSFTLILHCVSKKRPTLSFAVPLTNIDGFSKFFHWYILWKICNNAITKYPTTPELRRYTTLWNTNFQNHYTGNQNNYTCKKLFSETIFYYFNYLSSVIFSFRYILGVYIQR